MGLNPKHSLGMLSTIDIQIMRFRKKVLIGIGIIVIIGIAGVSLSIYLLTRPPEIENEIRPVKIGNEDFNSLDKKLKTLEEDIAVLVSEKRTGEVDLILSEAEASILLGRMMKDAISESPQFFSEDMILDTMVNLNDELIRAIIEMEIYGVRMSAGAEVRAVVENSKLKLELETIELGQFPFAGFVEDHIEETFRRSLSDMTFSDLHTDLDRNLPVELRDITIGEGELIITGMVL